MQFLHSVAVFKRSVFIVLKRKLERHLNYTGVANENEIKTVNKNFKLSGNEMQKFRENLRLVLLLEFATAIQKFLYLIQSTLKG